MDFETVLLPTIKFIIAVLVGGTIGWDREIKGKPAGLKTHALVCLGATIVTQIGILMYKSSMAGDPMRIAAQIVSGLGFLGAGVIMNKSDKVTGLTTAATLWLCGCIGICIGSDYYYLVIPAFIAYYLISHLFSDIEDKRAKEKEKDSE